MLHSKGNFVIKNILKTHFYIYLTEFNFRKTLENSLKNLFVSQSEKNKFYAIKPGPYQARFFDFIRTNVFVKVRDKRLRFSNKNN